LVNDLREARNLQVAAEHTAHYIARPNYVNLDRTGGASLADELGRGGAFHFRLQ
jgi:hypothetical protein